MRLSQKPKKAYKSAFERVAPWQSAGVGGPWFRHLKAMERLSTEQNAPAQIFAYANCSKVTGLIPIDYLHTCIYQGLRNTSKPSMKYR